jgi:transcriptional regulator with XRE-family HTH domain
MQSRKRNTPTREEALALFKELRPTYGLLQREIAKGTGLNQGSVSKILGGSFKKLEGRAYQVWKYASQKAAERGYKPSRQPARKPDPRLTEKIAQVWDRTEAGANALLKLLEAADLIQKRRRA